MATIKQIMGVIGPACGELAFGWETHPMLTVFLFFFLCVFALVATALLATLRDEMGRDDDKETRPASGSKRAQRQCSRRHNVNNTTDRYTHTHTHTGDDARSSVRTHASERMCVQGVGVSVDTLPTE
ncbi:hypothetical protein LZ32DRAFT_161466 [Colletotrichum eremochloae]|nr:hypothetical protein LZ32DRAFT_161466 [Colletotrichum eremochloae]